MKFWPWRTPVSARGMPTLATLEIANQHWNMARFVGVWVRQMPNGSWPFTTGGIQRDVGPDQGLTLHRSWCWPSTETCKKAKLHDEKLSQCERRVVDCFSVGLICTRTPVSQSVDSSDWSQAPFSAWPRVESHTEFGILPDFGEPHRFATLLWYWTHFHWNPTLWTWEQINVWSGVFKSFPEANEFLC